MHDAVTPQRGTFLIHIKYFIGPFQCICAPPPPPPQVCQVSAQQPVQTELLMRYHQLQSRLATLKIENEEVRIYDGSVSVQGHHPHTFSPNPLKHRALSGFPSSQERGPHHHLLSLQLLSNDPCSAEAENIFSTPPQCQFCVLYDVVFEIVYYEDEEGASSLKAADTKVQTVMLTGPVRLCCAAVLCYLLWRLIDQPCHYRTQN